VSATSYTEEYRGRTITVVRDDPWPVVTVHKGTYRGSQYLTVAQARRAVDHMLDRTCATHGGERRCPASSLDELREHGPYAGVPASHPGRRPPPAAGTGGGA